MPRYKLINGEQIQLTAEEETARDQEEAQAAIERQARIDAVTAAANNKASGKQKLKNLGLDDDEIKALIGV
tara:strand:+ start:697 stop:909 length:213 start_codon:yes stop_codon:yes gene_type:complete